MNDDTTNDIPEEGEEESFAELFESYSSGMNQDIQVGDKIRGKIISIGRDTVFMDTGTKIDGAVEMAELMDEEGQCPYSEGDELELYVTRVTENEIILSKAISGIGGLSQLQDAYDQKIPVEGKVTGTCKGGFEVEILKRRAFCPVSQLDLAYIETPEDYVGQAYSFLITRLEEQGRNIVVSRRQLLQQQRDEEQKEVFAKLTPDSEWEGRVTRLMPFGAFVDIGAGVEGMVHVSELSWSRVEEPKDVVKVGDRIRVKVLGIKPAEGKGGPRIALSAKQLQGNPWDNAGGRFKVGDLIEGKVVRCAPFGAFVEIAPGVDGLVHISEMSYEKRIHHPEDMVRPGDAVSVMVKEIDLSKRRIGLSIRDAKGDPWVDFKNDYRAGQRITGTLEKKEKFGYFINLVPGVTGLLPQSVINKAPERSDLEKLKSGSQVAVTIEQIKVTERKVSLTTGEASEDTDWRQHAPSTGGGSLGSLGEMLQQAMKSKQKKNG
jgi:small subunit ribosomal protein S1